MIGDSLCGAGPDCHEAVPPIGLDEGHIEDILMVLHPRCFFVFGAYKLGKVMVWASYFSDRDISRNLMLISMLGRTTISN
jgi:hypothetical protein